GDFHVTGVQTCALPILKRQGKDKTAMRGGILWDPLHVGFEKPIEMAQQFELAKRIFHWFADYPHFKSLCLDGTVYHNAGATAVQEIGYGLAALVELWDGLTEKIGRASCRERV